MSNRGVLTVRKLFSFSAGAVLALSAAALPAQPAAPAAEPPTAQALIEEITVRVMALMDEAESYIDDDPEKFYRGLRVILDDFVDFERFARDVMGEYAGRERYRSLDKAGQDALKAQAKRFANLMRQQLVSTYGKGLLAFGGSRTEVRPLAGAQSNERKTAIEQLIYSDEPEPYQIIYRMRRDRSGHWKLRNLIVENIDLGIIFRNQFRASAEDHDGDLDAVIDNWSVPAAAEFNGG